MGCSLLQLEMSTTMNMRAKAALIALYVESHIKKSIGDDKQMNRRIQSTLPTVWTLSLGSTLCSV